MKTDNLFFRLFQALPTLVLELAEIEIEIADACRYEFRAEEVKQTAFRLDGLLIPPTETLSAPLIFVEIQAQADDDFYGRFFSEIFLYLYRSVPRRPWLAVAIYPSRATERPDTRYNSLLSTPEVRRVYLNDWRERPAPTLGLQLIQLLIAPRKKACQQAVLLAGQARKGVLGAELSEATVLDLIETIRVVPSLNRQYFTNKFALNSNRRFIAQ